MLLAVGKKSSGFFLWNSFLNSNKYKLILMHRHADARVLVCQIVYVLVRICTPINSLSISIWSVVVLYKYEYVLVLSLKRERQTQHLRSLTLPFLSSYTLFASLAVYVYVCMCVCICIFFIFLVAFFYSPLMTEIT